MNKNFYISYVGEHVGLTIFARLESGDGGLFILFLLRSIDFTLFVVILRFSIQTCKTFIIKNIKQTIIIILIISL